MSQADSWIQTNKNTHTHSHTPARAQTHTDPCWLKVVSGSRDRGGSDLSLSLSSALLANSVSNTVASLVLQSPASAAIAVHRPGLDCADRLEGGDLKDWSTTISLDEPAEGGQRRKQVPTLGGGRHQLGDRALLAAQRDRKPCP